MDEKLVNPNLISKKAAIQYSKKNELDLVKFYIKCCKLDVNETDNYNDTALAWACYKGYFDIAKYLIIECEAKINTINKNKDTPLMEAAKNGYYDIIKLLLDNDDYNMN